MQGEARMAPTTHAKFGVGHTDRASQLNNCSEVLDTLRGGPVWDTYDEEEAKVATPIQDNEEEAKVATGTVGNIRLFHVLLLFYLRT